MARAYSQDLRERVLEAAAKGMSARQAAERFGIGVSTAIVGVRRARLNDERGARRHGQPKGSKLDGHRNYLLGLVEEMAKLATVQEGSDVSPRTSSFWSQANVRSGRSAP